ncbi:hypothetical protein GCM10011490_14830 [Pseudoclavibacter endophyticus]|uniref:Large extracellular alpha-helical protein n=1 Tax=Pseudoclavibacter endophyticus TaxID=1778590 RepID=A0A6H9WQ69_9MICO|nr:DUF5719 family protein [Pseudoclavibacter endophyticus]KAB1649127.1 hypothetical protein F8O04_02260 [Pseudoclavibacter endophyticus]GGA65178.1 hypothetical protein GCM10011490_14830 [Pseudoclavibacter endophyticus]
MASSEPRAEGASTEQASPHASPLDEAEALARSGAGGADAPLHDSVGRGARNGEPYVGGRGGGNQLGGRGLWARIGIGLVGIALAGATVWAVETAPLPHYAISPSALVLSPAPGDQQRVCPGPLTLLGQSSANPTAVGYKGYAEIVTAGNTDDLDISGIAPAVEAPASAPEPTEDAIGVPAYYQAPGVVGDRATILAISQSSAATEPGAAGFSATACTPASADQWLVGGSTAGGASTVLTLANPTEATATVRVSLYGLEGGLPAPGLDGIEVPAGTQVAVSLEGVAPEQAAFVAHLTTRGSVIGAALHEVGLEGLQPQGAEVISSSPSPSSRLDFVGVPFPTTAADPDEAMFGTRGAVLRLFAPGDGAAAVTITLRDGSGEALEPISLTLAPGVVSDVPLGEAPAGRYTVTVDGDSPVVASLRTSLVAEPFDFGWYQPSPPLDGATAIAVAPGPQPRLQLSTVGTIPVTVTLVHPDGTPERVTLQPRQTTELDVAAGAYRIDGMLQTVAQVTYDGPGQMSGVPVVGGSPLAADVTVYR